MAKYRYIFADVLTDQVNVELPLYGTSFSRRIVKPGECQGSIGLNTEGLNNHDIIDGTMPGRTCLYIERDGKIVWGGIIWSRTWQEQSKSFQFYGQEFPSYFFQADIRYSLAFTDQDQRNIVIDLINNCQSYYQDRNLGITLPTKFAPNIIRTTNFHWYDAWTFGKAMEYMAEFDEGLDYYIEAEYDDFGNFRRRLVINDRVGASLDDTQLIFDYPGSIKNFWWPENASRGATTIVGIGAGEGAASLRGLIDDFPKLLRAYPELVQFYTNKDISNQATLDSRIYQELKKVIVPVISPTYEIESDRPPEFGSYSLGDYAKIYIDSVRFKEPLESFARVVGWDVKPSQSSGSEEVKLLIAGEE